ncbi:hypothetical protein ASPZODRAFT_275215 [Penicilliopsis zonata CBS 506.65]|uniref:ASTRA-associated protein 1 n=1 Tax=Penicilliopsis zonata CBS 506.65 TaxID=1073090 RepID=A0A1L9SUN0_9EURO|nr:hypothetical protein ASPZODRAFT_275215 [Penicilliopsis zonata CBS 506.65]OJJ50846.1 hypothetical protein ASPZODRAFT_275215 [Penicilliopsis zonata CBS 506.65]
MNRDQQAPGPATPTYILRGHAAPIHALHIFCQNLRLVSGDAEGWIIVWDMVTKRPVAAWKAHEGAVLEVKGVSSEAVEIYTHGRDHKLRLWRFRAQEEGLLEKTLPVDAHETPHSEPGIQPWLVHSLPVNALNFCAFSILQIEHDKSDTGLDNKTSPVLVAVPNALDSGAIDLFHLPLERRISTVPAAAGVKTGMVMAVSLFSNPAGLYVCSAYEDGRVMVFVRRGALIIETTTTGPPDPPWTWENVYTSCPHSQPVLSIDLAPSKAYFLSSSADAVLAKHEIPSLPSASRALQDSPPKQSANTKHSGQQGLRIRDDGRIFATAGWDARIRVYSCKTMKELAVLKWHKEGCYAVAFGEINGIVDSKYPGDGSHTDEPNDSDSQALNRDESGFSLAAVQQQRNRKVQNTHWLAAGSKDGKISLWDIY